jgi:hypothetical protein
METKEQKQERFANGRREVCESVGFTWVELQVRSGVPTTTIELWKQGYQIPTSEHDAISKCIYNQRFDHLSKEVKQSQFQGRDPMLLF